MPDHKRFWGCLLALSVALLLTMFLSPAEAYVEAPYSLGRIIAESTGGPHQMKRTLGPVQLIALGIGAIIGSGLFSLTGVTAATVFAGSLLALNEFSGMSIVAWSRSILEGF